MRYFCTYFDRNYLAKGLTLVRSLIEHEGDNFRLYVVCMDELTRTILGKLAIRQLVLIPFHDIERGDQKLLACRANRSVVEYLWTTTPTIILRILERNPEIDLLTYLDADLFFFAKSNAIYDELGSRSILIHEHRFSPEHRESAKYGIFNVGLLCFRRDDLGLGALRWWRERCLEWCYSRVENGLFGDQVYLNDWPTRFSSALVVCQNVGVGLAPWNHSQYRYTASPSGGVTVNGTPLIVYHFHAFTVMNPELVIPVSDAGYRFPREVAQYCVVPYLQAFEESVKDILRVLPQFRFGIAKNDFELTEGHTLMVREFLTDEIRRLGLPQQQIFKNGGWCCFAGAQSLR